MAPALTVPKVSAAETGRGPATWHPTQGAAHGKRAGGRRPCWRQTLHNTHAWQASRTAPRPSSRGRDAARPGAQGSLPRLRLAVRRPGGSGSRCPSPAALGHLGSRSTGPWALLLWRAGRDPWPSPHSRGTAAAPRLTCIFMPSRPSLGRKRARSGSEGRAGARRRPQPCPATAAGSLHRDAERLPPGRGAPRPQGTVHDRPAALIPKAFPMVPEAALPSGVPRVCTAWWLLPPRRPSQASPDTGPLANTRRADTRTSAPGSKPHPPGPSPEVIGNSGDVLLERAGGRPVHVPAHEHVDSLRDLRGQARQRRVAQRAGAGAQALGPQSLLLGPSFLKPDWPQSCPRKPGLRERPKGAQGVHKEQSATRERHREPSQWRVDRATLRGPEQVCGG